MAQAIPIQKEKVSPEAIGELDPSLDVVQSKATPPTEPTPARAPQHRVISGELPQDLDVVQRTPSVADIYPQQLERVSTPFKTTAGQAAIKKRHGIDYMPTEQVSAGDFWDAFRAGGVDVINTIPALAEYIAPAGSEYEAAAGGVRKYLSDVANEIRAEMSPEAKAEMGKEFLAGGEDAAWKSLTSLGLKMAATAPTMIPALGVAGGLLRMGASGLLSGIASGTLEGSLSAGMTAADIANSIEQMPDDQFNALFKELVKYGKENKISKQKIRQMAIDEAQSITVPLSGIAVAGISAVGAGALLPKAIGPGAKFGRIRSMPRGMGAEAIPEALQSIPEQAAINVATGQPISTGMPEAIVSGGVLGAGMGGAATMTFGGERAPVDLNTGENVDAEAAAVNARGGAIPVPSQQTPMAAAVSAGLPGGPQTPPGAGGPPRAGIPMPGQAPPAEGGAPIAAGLPGGPPIAPAAAPAEAPAPTEAAPAPTEEAPAAPAPTEEAAPIEEAAPTEEAAAPTGIVDAGKDWLRITGVKRQGGGIRTQLGEIYRNLARNLPESKIKLKKKLNDLSKSTREKIPARWNKAVNALSKHVNQLENIVPGATEYLNQILQTGDPKTIEEGLGKIAKALTQESAIKSLETEDIQATLRGPAQRMQEPLAEAEIVSRDFAQRVKEYKKKKGEKGRWENLGVRASYASSMADAITKPGVFEAAREAGVDDAILDKARAAAAIAKNFRNKDIDQLAKSQGITDKLINNTMADMNEALTAMKEVLRKTQPEMVTRAEQAAKEYTGMVQEEKARVGEARKEIQKAKARATRKATKRQKEIAKAKEEAKAAAEAAKREAPRITPKAEKGKEVKVTVKKSRVEEVAAAKEAAKPAGEKKPKPIPKPKKEVKVKEHTIRGKAATAAVSRLGYETWEEAKSEVPLNKYQRVQEILRGLEWWPRENKRIAAQLKKAEQAVRPKTKQKYLDLAATIGEDRPPLSQESTEEMKVHITNAANAITTEDLADAIRKLNHLMNNLPEGSLDAETQNEIIAFVTEAAESKAGMMTDAEVAQAQRDADNLLKSQGRTDASDIVTSMEEGATELTDVERAAMLDAEIDTELSKRAEEYGIKTTGELELLRSQIQDEVYTREGITEGIQTQQYEEVDQNEYEVLQDMYSRNGMDVSFLGHLTRENVFVFFKDDKPIVQNAVNGIKRVLLDKEANQKFNSWDDTRAYFQSPSRQSELPNDSAIDINHILNLLSLSMGENHPYSYLVKTLQSLNLDTSVILMRNASMAKRAVASFEHEQNIIAFHKIPTSMEGFLHALIHETVHAGTIHGLHTNNLFAQQLESLRQTVVTYLANNTEELVKQGKIRHAIINPVNELYGLTNLNEFVAEALTNAEFQRVLRGIPAVSGEYETGLVSQFGKKINNLWDKFKNLVGNALGIRRADEYTLFNNVMDMIPGVLTTGEQVFKRKGKDSVLISKETGDLVKIVVNEKGKQQFVRGAKENSFASNFEVSAEQAFKTMGRPETVRRAKRTLLGLMTLDQINREFGNKFGGLFKEAINRYMLALRNKVSIAREFQKDGEVINRKMRDYERANGAESQVLYGHMIDTTMSGVHSDLPYSHAKNKHLHSQKNGLAKYQAAQKVWNTIGKEGQAIYSEVRDYFESQRKSLFKALMNQLGETLGFDTNTINKLEKVTSKKEIDDFIVGIEDNKLRQKAKSGITEILSMAKVEGPYFPLRRFGDYVVVGRKIKRIGNFADKDAANKFAATKRAELEVDDPTIKVKVEYSEESGTYRVISEDKVVTMHETEDEAKQAESDFAGKGYDMESVQRKQSTTLPRAVRAGTLVEMVKAKFAGSPAIQNALDVAYLEVLADSSMRKSEMKRGKVKGASKDMRRAFAERAYSGSWAIADIATASEQNKAMTDMRKAESRGGMDSVKMGEVIGELKLREDNELADRNPGKFTRGISTMGFLWFLGSPSYSMINSTQPMLVALPYLAAKHGGIIKAQRAMFKAYRMFSGAAAKALKDSKFGAAGMPENILDLVKKNMTSGQKSMIDELVNRGIIDATFVQELYEAAGGVSAGGAFGKRTKAANAVNKMMDIARATPQTIEVLNRVVTAVATYEMTGGDIEAAAEAVLETQFDYSVLNKPRLFKSWTGARSIMMFKMYAQGMYALLGSNLGRIISSASTKEERMEAIKIVGGVLGTHSLAAGTVGALFMEPVKLMIAAAGAVMGGDDWDEQLQEGYRNALADIFGLKMGEIIARGVPRAIGLDLSQRIGLGNLMFMGVQDARSYEDKWKNTLVAGLGPMGALSVSVARGFDYMQNGQFAKGLASMSPKFSRDVYNTIAMYSDGMTDSRGNMIASPNKFGMLDLLYQFVGIQPSIKAEIYEGRRTQIRTEMSIRDTQNELRAQWKNASPTERGKIWARKIIPFNREFPGDSITMKSLRSGLEKRKQRERETKRGAYTKSKVAREQARYANVE